MIIVMTTGPSIASSVLTLRLTPLTGYIGLLVLTIIRQTPPIRTQF